MIKNAIHSISTHEMWNRRRLSCASLLIAAAICILAAGQTASAQQSYKQPPKEILDVLRATDRKSTRLNSSH